MIALLMRLCYVYKRKEVMFILNISTATVDRWLRDGKLKATK